MYQCKYILSSPAVLQLFGLYFFEKDDVSSKILKQNKKKESSNDSSRGFENFGPNRQKGVMYNRDSDHPSASPKPTRSMDSPQHQKHNRNSNFFLYIKNVLSFVVIMFQTHILKW